MAEVATTSPSAAGTLPAAAPAPQKLDDLMLAMDVVDTLRHQEGLASKELDEDARKAELIERLKKIYAGQGIAVPDRIVEEGVKALEESRFVYTPTPASFSRTLSTMWVDRGRWGKIIGAGALVLAIALGSFQYFVVGAGRRAEEAARVEITQTLPAMLAKAKRTALDESTVEAAKAKTNEIAGRAEAAIARKDVPAAKAAIGEIDGLVASLRETYQIRIVTRQGERSGVFRTPPRNPSGRNYYLIVEAVGADGRVQPRSITSEEDGTTTTVTKWGQRVPQTTYDQVARDKQDDGIIQMTRLGEKRRGELDVRWTLPVTTGAITKW